MISVWQRHADIHLKLKPGTNVAFANGIMHVIISEGGLQDDKFIAERTEGYEKIKEIVKDYTPETSCARSAILMRKI